MTQTSTSSSCPRCGAPQQAETAYCSQCGLPLTAGDAATGAGWAPPQGQQWPAQQWPQPPGYGGSPPPVGSGRSRRVALLAVAVVFVLVVAALTYTLVVRPRLDPREQVSAAFAAQGDPWRARDARAYCKAAYAFGPDVVFKDENACVDSIQSVFKDQSEEDLRREAASIIPAAKVHLLADGSAYYDERDVEFPLGTPTGFVTPQKPAYSVLRKIDGRGWLIVGTRFGGQNTGIVPPGVPT